MVFRISRPQEFFPAPVTEQVAIVAAAAASLSDDDIAWISENRDFSEAERYREKDDVDEALVASPLVSAERKRIEQMFDEEEPVRAGERYLRAHAEHMSSLHRHFAGAATEGVGDALNVSFWRRAITIADIDNAHAMYLSSDNWPFSVFHKLIDELADFIGDDQEAFASILMAGVQDARTSVFNMFGDVYRGLDRRGFAVAVRANADWVRPDGVMPLFAFKAATEAPSGAGRVADSKGLRKQYEAAVGRVLMNITERERPRFAEVCETYQRLYAARAAYDIYEYFGFYAFARHLTIQRATRALEQSSREAARNFHYSASTYQFVELEGLMSLQHQEM
ncbi:MAG: hypothetical protein LC802_24200 [Acidobacteria bacterium]|nr:hypothetical protein [Acidobacteriota bacterium]